MESFRRDFLIYGTYQTMPNMVALSRRHEIWRGTGNELGVIRVPPADDTELV